MKIVQIISEHKKKHIGTRYRDGKMPISPCPVKSGHKRVEAIVEKDGELFTEHLDIPNPK